MSRQLQLAELEGEGLGRDERGEAIGGAEVVRVAVAVRRRLAEHPGRQPNRVNDPKLANAEAGVKRRLAADIVAERRVRDLDDEQNIVSSEAGYAARLRKDDDVRFEIRVFAETERGRDGEIDIAFREAIPSIRQRCLDDFMMVSLRRHRNQFPPDQLDPLVLLHHAGGDHCLHFGGREAPARQTFGCGCGELCGGTHILASYRRDFRLRSAKRNAKASGANSGTIRSAVEQSCVSR